MAADQGVDELDVVAVGGGEGGGEGRVVARQLEEGGRRGEAQEAAEGVVTWDAAFAVAEEVDGAWRWVPESAAR